MEGVVWLMEARAAGLQMRADEEELIIRGPKRLAALAQQLLSHKETIMAMLEVFEERAAIAEYDGRLSRDDAERLAWESFS